MAFEGNGSKEVMNINGAEYQLTLDGRGSGKNVNQIIVAPSGETSVISFSEDAKSVLVADPASVGLPATIDRTANPTKIVTEKKYLNILYLSLALIIAGVGYLKANISTIVGSLYGVGDARRDSGSQFSTWVLTLELS